MVGRRLARRARSRRRRHLARHEPRGPVGTVDQRPRSRAIRSARTVARRACDTRAGRRPAPRAPWSRGSLPQARAITASTCWAATSRTRTGDRIAATACVRSRPASTGCRTICWTHHGPRWCAPRPRSPRGARKTAVSPNFESLVHHSGRPDRGPRCRFAGDGHSAPPRATAVGAVHRQRRLRNAMLDAGRDRPRRHRSLHRAQLRPRRSRNRRGRPPLHFVRPALTRRTARQLPVTAICAPWRGAESRPPRIPHRRARTRSAHRTPSHASAR